ncbi:MAG: hypothetical protein ACTHW3_10670 [Leucobacter sp.]|uniref:hypothetical protein n=2 Tax=Agrococcus casei TaxID=343512 RepID=UPI003F936FD5
MSSSKGSTVPDRGIKAMQLLNTAAKAPGVRIDRTAYLQSALKRYCTETQIEQAIATSPAEAGVPSTVIKSVADASINFETAKVTALSTASGIPGGIALIGTVPADVVQYFGHMLRITQKLAYIYSWPDLFEQDGEELDDGTQGILTLFLGVMFGAQIAQSGVAKVSQLIAAQALKQLPRQALTKGIIYPLVKRVASYLGARMTTQIFAGGVAKVIPIVGAILSGGLSFGTFLPMAKRLQKHLASLELTQPRFTETNTQPK